MCSSKIYHTLFFNIGFLIPVYLLVIMCKVQYTLFQYIHTRPYHVEHLSVGGVEEKNAGYVRVQSHTRLETPASVKSKRRTTGTPGLSL